MRCKMQTIFKIGLSLVILLSIWLYYIVNHREVTDGNVNQNGSPNGEEKLPRNDVQEGVYNSREKQQGNIHKKIKHDVGVDTTEQDVEVNSLEDRVNAANLKITGNEEHSKKSVEENTDKKKPGNNINDKLYVTSIFKDEFIHLSVVACGDRLEETLVMLKSAYLLAKSKLMFHIFADDDLQSKFRDQLESWPEEIKSRIVYKIYPITFPEGQNAQEWKKLFKPCASQRLFLPHVLKDVDSLLYVDTDILFLRPIDDVWNHFTKFNSSQLAALAPEHESPSAGWYNRFARHPYYGPLGVNSGVMLMNLTRIRDFHWLEMIIDFYKIYKYNITWGDQDLINIVFHYHPDKLYIYQCDWNYRPDHCMYMSNCKPAEHNGVSVLHGNRGVLHNDKQPTFKAIYNAFKDFKFDDSLDSLLKRMKDNLATTVHTQCGKVASLFTKQMEHQISYSKL